MSISVEERGVVDLSGLIPEEDWAIHRPLIEMAREQKISFALGGGLAFSAYSGRWRNTKDLDLFILPEDRDRMVELVKRAGYEDYFDQLPYDRTWIYRACKGEVITDLIWTMPNHRLVVDQAWFTRSRDIHVYEMHLPILPVEELIWSKLFVLQRDRCDWPDVLNIVRWAGSAIDWRHLLRRLDEDALILGSLLNLYRWLCPEQAAELPAWLWPEVGLNVPQPGLVCEQEMHRAHLLDTRDWFGPNGEGR